ncbi:hypothetical protein FRC15_011198 [Serendipita sp. 397]|nr:hypothetical protein FRC15_011198 [Serendipita sp. 397]
MFPTRHPNPPLPLDAPPARTLAPAVELTQFTTTWTTRESSEFPLRNDVEGLGSTDACMTSFTTGQITRATSQSATYRGL